MKILQSFKYLLVMFLFTSPSNASDDFEDAIQVIGGIYAGTYIHEVGHAVTAKLNGATYIDIEVPRKGTLFSGQTIWRSPKKPSPLGSKLIDISGLLTANLAGEIIIQKDGLHSKPFASGIVSSVQASNLIHVASYYMGKNNDIKSFEREGGNAHLFSALLIGYTLYSLDRMEKKQIPLFGVNFNF